MFRVVCIMDLEHRVLALRGLRRAIFQRAFPQKPRKASFTHSAETLTKLALSCLLLLLQLLLLMNHCHYYKYYNYFFIMHYPGTIAIALATGGVVGIRACDLGSKISSSSWLEGV